MSARKILILGATSAIAQAYARLRAEEGASFLLAGRQAARLEEIAADLSARGATSASGVTLDLANQPDPDEAFAGLVEALGGIDELVVAYGVLGDQGTAEGSAAEARALIDSNFTSAALWLLAAARVMKAQGSGALVALSSVAGDRGRQSNFVYGAAKGGLSLLMQGLAHRLAGSGVGVVNIKAGFVDTPMTAGIANKGGPLWATPHQIATVMKKAVDGGRGPHVYAPWFWRFVMLIIRVVPPFIFHKTKL